MIKIKICGIRTMQDVEYINILRPDYVGFVFAKSKRQVSLEEALKLRECLLEGIKTVGVFVDEDKNRVLKIGETLSLDIIQLHGSEDLDYMYFLKDFEIWKAIGIKTEEDIKKIEKYKGYKILLDSATVKGVGGTGERFSWHKVDKYFLNKEVFKNNIILAGGLNSSNVLEGMEVFKPCVVDVSSGVETGGSKDYVKMKEFIERVRQYDKR